jgi:uncharacterized protein (TIGR02118 family)
MVKIVATWSAPKPEDVSAFEEYYAKTHVPLAAAAPGLRRLVLTRTTSGLEGNAPAFYRVAELHFDDLATLERSAHSAQWTRMREDAGKMIERFGVSLQVGIGEEVDAPLVH